jgi:hypothetical protein
LTKPSTPGSRTAWLGLVVLLAGAQPAHAQDQKETLAEALFQDGRQLMEKGSYADACPKLARSHQLDPAGGTVLLLAMCYEQAGKVASAWLRYNDALGFARRDGRDDRAERAKEHLAVLTPRLSRVTVVLPKQVAESKGAKLMLDGTELPAESTNSLPVDPGSHHLLLSAAGKQAWSASFVVMGDGQTVTLTAPELEDLPVEPRTTPGQPAPLARAPAPEPSERNRTSPWRTAGFVVGSAGVVSLGVGAYFGLSALSRMSDARKHCSSPPSCTDPGAVRSSQDATSAALRADVFLGAGLVAVATGVILITTSRSHPERGATLYLAPRGQGGMLGAAGRF